MSHWDKEIEIYDKAQASSDKKYYGRNVSIGVNLEKFDTLHNVPKTKQRHKAGIRQIQRAYKPIKKSMMNEPDSYFNGKHIRLDGDTADIINHT